MAEVNVKSGKYERELLTRDELLRQSKDYFDIADQENLEKAQKDRLRRAAAAMAVCARSAQS
jgi:hypothetical protein